MRAKCAIWAVLTFAVGTIDALKNTCSAGTPRSIAHCIHRHGKNFAKRYCASVLAITTSTVQTTTTLPNIVTTDITETTGLTTVTGRPQITETTTITESMNRTEIFTQTSTVITATITSSLTSISLSTLYTCGARSSTNSGFHNTTSLPTEHHPSAGSGSLSVTRPHPSATGDAGNHSSIGTSWLNITGPHSPSTSSVGNLSSSGLGSLSLTGVSSFLTHSSRNHSSEEATPPSVPGRPPPQTNNGGHHATDPGTHPSGTHSAGRHPPTGSISLTDSHPSVTVSAPGSHSSNSSLSADRPPPLIPTCSYPPYHATREKRQAAPVPTLRCLKKYRQALGDAAISEGCECFHTRSPRPVISTVTITDQSNSTTLINTRQVEGTTTLTPTETSTHFETTAVPRSTSKIVTTSIVKTVFSTIVSTSTITLQSPTPASFRLMYPIPFSTGVHQSPPLPFLGADPAPGGSGIVVAAEDEGDWFSLDSSGRLVDMTDGTRFIARNTEDLYPFQLLRTNATLGNTPTCSICNSVLQCDYPGTSGNSFALCYGYLALGPDNIFGKDSDNNTDVDCYPFNPVIQ